MSDTKGFFQLILLSFGVLVVFTLLAYMSTPTFEIIGGEIASAPWEAVLNKISPLILVICFVGFAAYVVTHR